MTKPVKRGPGRPRLEPQSAEQLREKAKQRMQASSERLGRINYVEVEGSLETMLSKEKLQQSTRAELKELRRMAERLWDKFEIEKEYEEDLQWSFGSKRERTSASEEWDKNHEDIAPKRKNAKKTKSIYDLTEKQKFRKGISVEPMPMEFDVNATEKELTSKLVEREASERALEGQFLQGRRLTGRKKADPAADQKRSFLY